MFIIARKQIFFGQIATGLTMPPEETGFCVWDTKGNLTQCPAVPGPHSVFEQIAENILC